VRQQYFCAILAKTFQDKHKESELCRLALLSESHMMSVCIMTLTVDVQITGSTHLSP